MSLTERGRLRLNRIGKGRQYGKDAMHVPVADVHHVLKYYLQEMKGQKELLEYWTKEGDQRRIEYAWVRHNASQEIAKWLLAIIEINKEKVCDESEQTSV